MAKRKRSILLGAAVLLSGCHYDSLINVDLRRQQCECGKPEAKVPASQPDHSLNDRTTGGEPARPGDFFNWYMQ